MINRYEILRHPRRHNLGRANMAGPMIGGIARWRNPSGFFILRDRPRLLHFLTRHGFWGSGSGSFWGCGLDYTLNTTLRIPLRPSFAFVKKRKGVWGFFKRLLRMKSQHCEGGEQYNTMILTKELIHSVKNGTGGWNKPQLELLGVKWPPPKGWIERLAGTEIEEGKFTQILSLRGAKWKKRKRDETRKQAQEDYLFLLAQTLPICSRCKVNKVYNGSENMDWCSDCIWEFVKDDSNN